MAISGIPKHLVIDDFLPASLVADLLGHALENQGLFELTDVMKESGPSSDFETRVSQIFKQGLGPHKPAFKAAIHARLDEFFNSLGVEPFAVARTELQLIAHGNDAFYRAHIDTAAGPNGLLEPSVRILSAVYYFHRQPKGFTGGELSLFQFGKGDEAEHIAPLHNRLVVFPSFARHEVRKVVCPSGLFEDSRFSINCWLHKQRSEQLGPALDTKS